MAPLWRRSMNSFSKALPLMDDGEYEGMGSGWSDKGGLRENRIMYPSRKTSTTQASTPRAIQAGQKWPRQPPILGEEGFFLCWKRPEEEDGGWERCEFERGDVL